MAWAAQGTKVGDMEQITTMLSLILKGVALDCIFLDNLQSLRIKVGRKSAKGKIRKQIRSSGGHKKNTGE